MSRGSTVVCINCEEAISADARICPHCGELQPSPLLAALLAVIGVFAILVGFPVAAFTVGLVRWAGFAGVLVGIGLVFGGYTSYIDAQAQRSRRAR
ncbi:zinc ribbon domain-containing protein [Haloparvum sedimenti]|uniref:zinc ribbon domain-containing protein n=1 Tax=Haloparvum sedimenti TaxID=1678448 RepID=UPI00071E7B9A|nr:zinc ribbon domain-containing protein [Haloparvum sedimenti]